MTFRIRLLSACRRTELQVGDYHFSASFSAEEADALLCEWAPHKELLSFPRPKAWYCCEATNCGLFQTSEWRTYRADLKPSEFLYHAHPDTRYRVPHMTMEDDPGHPDNRGRTLITSEKDSTPIRLAAARLKKAVAIVSNTGGSPWRRGKDLSLRARFVTHPAVDLYGRRESWENFRRGLFSRPALPPNYQGEIRGYWTDPARFDLMSRYRAAVCSENTCEPYYFTEKFVGAVQAGCIPIYHAHETVRESVLQGALWVDPASFGYDISETLEYALGENIEKYWATNGEWLKTEAVRATRATAVFERIGEILYEAGQQMSIATAGA